MGLGLKLGRKKPLQSASGELTKLLQQLDKHIVKQNRAGKEFSETGGFKKKDLSVAGKTPAEKEKEIHVDGDALKRLVAIIQETMDGQDDSSDKRWSKRLQWPSPKYLRTSWVQVWEQLQPDCIHYKPGEAKILSANAGDIACLGPCLLQAPDPVQTLIVHGEMEYCTLLGHVLHIDLAVYFAALRTFARFLKGNKHIRELVFAFTSCPQVVTDKTQEPVSEGFAAQVLPAFEQVLVENENLRYVSFRMCHTMTQSADVARLCSTFYEANCRLRTAVVCAAHPKVSGASPLASRLPRDVLKKILDLAFPMPGPPRVDFEFSHMSSAENRSKFVFLRFGARPSASQMTQPAARP